MWQVCRMFLPPINAIPIPPFLLSGPVTEQPSDTLPLPTPYTSLPLPPALTNSSNLSLEVCRCDGTEKKKKEKKINNRNSPHSSKYHVRVPSTPETLSVTGARHQHALTSQLKNRGCGRKWRLRGDAAVPLRSSINHTPPPTHTVSHRHMAFLPAAC